MRAPKGVQVVTWPKDDPRNRTTWPWTYERSAATLALLRDVERYAERPLTSFTGCNHGYRFELRDGALAGADLAADFATRP